MFDVMVEVFGHDHAQGTWAQTIADVHPNSESNPIDSPQPYAPMTENLGLDEESNAVESMYENESQFEFTQAPPGLNQTNSIGSMSQNGHVHRGRKKAKAIFNELISSMATSISKVAVAIRDSPGQPVNTSVLLNALLELDGFDTEFKDMAFEYLENNPSLAQVFMAHEQEGRTRFLIRCLTHQA